MKKTVERIFDVQDRQVGKNAYLERDGILYCKTCQKPMETRLNVQGVMRKLPVACDCDIKKLEAYKKREAQQELERQKRICFGETNMANWTFDNDDKSNEKLSNAMRRYSADFKRFKSEGKGLLLYGAVGTGKTYYAACVANELIDNGYTVLMSNFSQLINKLQGMYEGKDEFIAGLNRYSLLIIDDLGVERNTEYVQEIVFNIIDSRYRSGLPMIITTNLSADDLKRPKDVGDARIYDRLYERCFPIAVEGGSRRKKALKDSYSDMKNRLGL